MMNRNIFLAILVVFLLALMSHWLVVKNRPADVFDAGDIDLRFDYVLSEFSLRIFAADGTLEAKLNSPEITQSAANLTSRINTPTLVLPNYDNGMIKLTAARADISDDHNHITLTGDVMLQQTARDNDTLKLVADSLELDISAGKIQTDGPVAINKPGMKLTGTGMRANLNDETYRLLAKVEGSYEQR